MTGQRAAASTREATLPRKSFARPVRPWVPMTIRSAFFDLAARAMPLVRNSVEEERGRLRARLARLGLERREMLLSVRAGGGLEVFVDLGDMYPSPAIRTGGASTWTRSSCGVVGLGHASRPA